MGNVRSSGNSFSADSESTDILEFKVDGDDHPRMVVRAGEIVTGDGTAAPAEALGSATIATDGFTVTGGALTLQRTDEGPATAPEIDWKGPIFPVTLKYWKTGVDVANEGGLVLCAEVDADLDTVTDFVYVIPAGDSETGRLSLGVGMTPPDGSHALEVAGGGTQGSIRAAVASGQTGTAFAVEDSGDTPRFWIDKDSIISGLNGVYGGSVVIQGDVTDNRPLSMLNNGKTVNYGFRFDGSEVKFRYFTGGQDAFSVGTDGRFKSQIAPNFSGTGAQLPHAGAGTPTGGYTGEVRVGTDKIWVNDAGTWKSVAVA